MKNPLDDIVQQRALVAEYIDTNAVGIWRLYERGFLFRLFKSESGRSMDYIIKFADAVNNVLTEKSSLNCTNISPAPLDGRWLAFDATITMYDCLAEQESQYFYDSDDVPPPEFWVSIKDSTLLSYIPRNYLNRAASGVDCSISGSLYWV